MAQDQRPSPGASRPHAAPDKSRPYSFTADHRFERDDLSRDVRLAHRSPYNRRTESLRHPRRPDSSKDCRRRADGPTGGRPVRKASGISPMLLSHDDRQAIHIGPRYPDIRLLRRNNEPSP